MNTKRVQAAEGVILAAMKDRVTAAGIAIALESACLLQSPESAAEARQLQDDITGACLARYEEEQENARLLEERHSTNEALSDAVEQLRAQRDRIAELEAAAQQIRHLHTDSPMGVCPTCFDGDAAAAGGDGLVPYPCPTAQLTGAQDWDPCRPCGCPKRFDRHAWGCPTLPADDVPLLGQLEDPHDGPNHHDYALGRDLPFIPGQTTGRCPQGHTFEDCTCGGVA